VPGGHGVFEVGGIEGVARPLHHQQALEAFGVAEAGGEQGGGAIRRRGADTGLAVEHLRQQGPRQLVGREAGAVADVLPAQRPVRCGGDDGGAVGAERRRDLLQAGARQVVAAGARQAEFEQALHLPQRRRIDAVGVSLEQRAVGGAQPERFGHEDGGVKIV